MHLLSILGINHRQMNSISSCYISKQMVGLILYTGTTFKKSQGELNKLAGKAKSQPSNDQTQ
jgi:hypothetical protein